MSQKMIYEQVSASRPGQPFVPSGLYRLAGHMVHRRFVRAATPTPLKTLKQWNAAQAPALPEANGRWRCPQCLTLLPVELDATGQYKPCTSCGYGPWIGPQHRDSEDKFTTYAAPDTLGRAVALQRHPDLVSESNPVPVTRTRVGPPRRRETYAPHGETTARAVALQESLGIREKTARPLRAMDASRPCGRCRKTDCHCPPSAPDTLTYAASQQALDIAAKEEANVRAGLERIRKV